MSLLLLNDRGGIPRNGLVGLWSLPGVDPRINPGARWEQAARNLIDWSEDATNAVWTKSNVTADDATHLTFTAQNGYVSQLLTIQDGVQITLYARMANISGNTALHWYHNGIGSGSTAVTINATLTDYALTLTGDGASASYGIQDQNASGWGQIEVTRWAVIPGSHTAEECAALYEKTEDRQSFYDFSYNGNHAQRGSTTGSDTNDPSIVPTCRNELAAGSTEDLTDSNWTLTDATATATTFTPSAQNGQVAQSFPARSGIEYVLAADIASAGNTVLTWLHIGAAGGDTDPVTVSPAADRYSVTFTGSSAVGAAAFTGSGLDDATSGGTYATGYQPTTFRVEIDGTGSPDTFKWSEDGGVTWTATGVAITGAAQTLSRGVTVTFGATTGHTAGDYWDIAAGANVSLGLRDANASGFGAITFTRVQAEVGSIATYYANPATESVPLLEFDGVDDYIHVANAGALDLNRFTLLALYVPYDVELNKFHGLISKRNSAASKANYFMRVRDGRLSAGFYNGTDWFTHEFSGSDHSARATYVAVVTYDGAGLTGFLGGQQVGEKFNTTGSPQADSNNLYIGNVGDGSQSFSGRIFLAGAYNRPLSASEVARLCQNLAQQAWDHWGVAVRGYESTICQKPPMHLGV